MSDGAPNYPSSTDDDDLIRRLRTFLFCKNVRGPLSIEATGGIVTLRGLVQSFYHRQLLVHGARRVAGVLRVVDQLDVAACSARPEVVAARSSGSPATQRRV